MGAVVGKVFENPRVEEVFLAGGRWQLRTPAGVFPLPITAEIEDLRWGDVDNTLVGRTALGPAAPNLFRAYRINRAPGSDQVPMRVEGADLVVDVEALRVHPQDPEPGRVLPDGLAVGTTVVFTGVNQFAYDLLTFTGEQTILYDPSFPGNDPHDKYFTWPVLTDLQGKFQAASSMTVSAEARETLEIRDLQIPIVLHRARYGASSARPYYWTVREIGLDARGRMLAVVEVVLTAPENNERFVPITVRHRSTGAPMIFFNRLLSVHFPVRTLLFALVDVASGTVIASTATAQVNIVTDSTSTHTIIQKGVTDVVHVGPLAGQQITLWEFASTVDADLLPPGPGLVVNASQTTVDGLRALTVGGWLKPEIRPLVYSHVTIEQLPPRTTPQVYALVEPDGSPPTYLAYSQTVNAYSQSGHLTHLGGARRKRPDAAAGQVLLFTRPTGISEGDEAFLVSWQPAEGLTPGQAALALSAPLPASESHRLAEATSQRALVVSDGTSTFVDLGRRTALQFFGDDLSNRFVLLDPAFLYHVHDLRFHRPRPTGLIRTALPARLAPVDPNPVGDYHLIRPTAP